MRDAVESGPTGEIPEIEFLADVRTLRLCGIVDSKPPLERDDDDLDFGLIAEIPAVE